MFCYSLKEDCDSPVWEMLAFGADIKGPYIPSWGNKTQFKQHSKQSTQAHSITEYYPLF